MFQPNLAVEFTTVYSIQAIYYMGEHGGDLQSIDARILFLETFVQSLAAAPAKMGQVTATQTTDSNMDWTSEACGKRPVREIQVTFGPAPCTAHGEYRRGEPYRDHDRGGDQWRQDVLHSCFSARETDFLESLSLLFSA